MTHFVLGADCILKVRCGESEFNGSAVVADASMQLDLLEKTSLDLDVKELRELR